MDGEAVSVNMDTQEDAEEAFPATIHLKDFQGRQLKLTLDMIQAKAIKKKLEHFIYMARILSDLKKRTCTKIQLDPFTRARAF